ncbi:MAG: L,D-transpeptidase [Paramuribaculum sp.]|nr:L,D-transpeptidase [Paramuribaculum sp.]
MRLTIISVLAVVAAIAASCSGNKATDTTEIVIDTVPLDSLTIEEVPEPFVDSVLTSPVATAAEAIAYMNSSADSAKYAEGILPAMATDNLDYCNRLLQSRYPYFIVVDKPSMYVVLFDRFGRETRAYKMACSKRYGTKHKRRDNRTPEGFFSAEGIYDSTDWLYTDDDGNTSPLKGQFGPRFIRLKTDVTRQVGIHGTCAPWALGRRASHGCIRIHNDNILELVTFAQPGMPIIVNPSARDNQVNRLEGAEVPTINIGRLTATNAKAISDEAALAQLRADSIAALGADTAAAAPDSIVETPASAIDTVATHTTSTTD